MPSRVVSRVLAVAVAIGFVVVSGCRVDTTIEVVVAPGGGGVVKVEVSLDAVAAAQLGAETEEVVVDDLVLAGWDVSGPVRSDDGVSFRASKAFRGPDELSGVLGEVSGATSVEGVEVTGWLSDWQLEVTDGFASTTYRLDGAVTMAGDLGEFGDAGTSEALDGFPLGRSPDELVAAMAANDTTVTLTVSAEVPGGGLATTTVDLTDNQPVDRELSAIGTVTSGRTRVLLAGAVTLGILGGALIVFGLGRGRRPKSQPSAATPQMSE